MDVNRNVMRVKMEMLMRAKTEKILMRVSMHAYGNQTRTEITKGNVDATAKGNVDATAKENYEEYIDNLKIQKVKMTN